MGKRKIDMQKIEDKQRRRVALSKRKDGLFKKASKLASDFGVEVAVLGFTVGGKPFSFGSSSVNDIIDKYFQNQIPEPTEEEKNQCMTYKKELHVKLANQLQAVAKLEEELLVATEEKSWYSRVDMAVNELMEYASALKMSRETTVQALASFSLGNTREDDHSSDKNEFSTYSGLREYMNSIYCDNKPFGAAVQHQNMNCTNSMATSDYCWGSAFGGHGVIGDTTHVDSSHCDEHGYDSKLFSAEWVSGSHSKNDPCFLPALVNEELEVHNGTAYVETCDHCMTAFQGGYLEEVQGNACPCTMVDHIADLCPGDMTHVDSSHCGGPGYDSNVFSAEWVSGCHSNNDLCFLPALVNEELEVHNGTAYVEARNHCMTGFQGGYLEEVQGNACRCTMVDHVTDLCPKDVSDSYSEKNMADCATDLSPGDVTDLYSQRTITDYMIDSCPGNVIDSYSKKNMADCVTDLSPGEDVTDFYSQKTIADYIIDYSCPGNVIDSYSEKHMADCVKDLSPGEDVTDLCSQKTIADYIIDYSCPGNVIDSYSEKNMADCVTDLSPGEDVTDLCSQKTIAEYMTDSCPGDGIDSYSEKNMFKERWKKWR